MSNKKNQPYTHNSLSTESSVHHGLFKSNFDYQPNTHTHAKGFFHPWRLPQRQGKHVLSWLMTRRPARWPDWELNLPLTELPSVRPSADLNDWKVWFIGHVTCLIQIGRYNFLTDPVWAMRASPVGFAGPKRVRAAGLALEQLPKIDAVLLSHNHYDHMDLAALNWLHQRDQMPIYTGLANAQYLPKSMNVVEMDWWDRLALPSEPNLQIVFTPAQHFSGRGLRDGNQALWGGLSILTPDDHLFFAGDTGYSAHFTEIKQRLGAPRLALLPIGAYEPRAIMRAMHMNPADAVQAHLDLAAQRSMAIHYRTFQLTDEAMHQPLLDLAVALTEQQLVSDCFCTPLEGEMVVV